MKKIFIALFICTFVLFTGCNNVLNDYSSVNSIDVSDVTIVSSISNDSSVTSSINSVISSENNTTTTKNNSSSNDDLSSKTSSVQDTSSESKPDVARPENITKIYDFNINTSVSDPIKQTFIDKQNGNKLPYCLYLPDKYSSSKKYPVILFLHGAGEIGSDNTSQLNNIKNMFTYNADYIAQSILICPQTPEWWHLDRNVYEDGQGTLTSAIHLLQEIQNKYSCDKNRTYLTGLSMGSFATWEVLERYGDMFAAAVPVCGGGNEMNAQSYVDIPIVMYHGTADPTVSFQSSQRTYDAILAAGGTKALLIPLEGVAHDAWKNAYADRNMFAWLFAQDKSKDTFVEYKVSPCFRIVDSSNNIIISDSDLIVADYSVDYAGSTNDVDIKIWLNDNGVQKLKNAYLNSKGKEFTVYCLSQKMYSFTATNPPVDDLFLIKGIFNLENYREFYETLNLACFNNY